MGGNRGKRRNAMKMQIIFISYRARRAHQKEARFRFRRGKFLFRILSSNVFPPSIEIRPIENALLFLSFLSISATLLSEKFRCQNYIAHSPAEPFFKSEHQVQTSTLRKYSGVPRPKLHFIPKIVTTVDNFTIELLFITGRDLGSHRIRILPPF